MQIFESGEDYLERILILKETLGKVRSIDIVNDMNFSKPSVSIAMKKLKNANLIAIDEKGYITLTEEGNKIAERIYERHRILTCVLVDLGVDEEQAKKDACKIEHDLSDETFNAIKKYYQKTGE